MSDLSAFDEGPQEAPAGDLEKIVKLARQATGLEETIEGIEQALKEHKKELHHIRTKLLPDAMAETGMANFETSEGIKISIDDFVSGSLPKDEEKRALAVEELERIGGGGLMRDSLSIDFDKSQHNEALDIAASLREKGWPVDLKSNVHPQALQAFIREKLRSGEEVNYERIGIYVGRIAKVKSP